jgi:hypothetical protein
MRAEYFRIVCLLFAGMISAMAAPAEQELIADNHFQQGFVLWETAPGKHVKYGELPGVRGLKPFWGLSQWSSRFPLAADAGVKLNDGAVVWSNAAKSVTVGPASSARADICLAVNTGVEYQPKSRNAGEPWVHLLVEQEFESPVPLAKISAAKIHVEARLLRAQKLTMTNYTPDVHAAQFQIYLTVQNRQPGSKGYGDLVWFEVPIYDDRDRFPKEFKAQDFGGTGKFIFTPNGKTFSDVSAHDGKWVTIDKDLLPMLREALKEAWVRGFVKDSKESSDYYIGGVYMGWELPGSFDVAMQVRNLSLKAKAKP